MYQKPPDPRVLPACARRLVVAWWIAAAAVAPAIAQAPAPAGPDGLRGPFSAGLYVGEVYRRTYLTPLYAPNQLDLSSTYIIAANFNYRLWRLPNVPMQFEMESDIAGHFGDARQYEAVVAPFIRWTAFPWNRVLYTNVRASVLGLSYSTGISAWEKQNSGHGKGSNFLQFGALEISFASHAESRWEVFLRLHHRSGIYGLINGVDGGSSYLAAGFRVFR